MCVLVCCVLMYSDENLNTPIQRKYTQSNVKSLSSTHRHKRPVLVQEETSV